MACNLVKLGRDLKHDLGPQKVATRKGNALISGKSTLPETNKATANRSSQKETSIPTIHFQVLLLLVSGRV